MWTTSGQCYQSGEDDGERELEEENEDAKVETADTHCLVFSLKDLDALKSSYSPILDCASKKHLRTDVHFS